MTISVIIPVYNVEAYLDRCLESVVNQTYRDLEIILVDDGSTDGSPALCDIWARKDERIKVIHKKNGGASSARNRGIEMASGEFIGFVDSDDWIESETYEFLQKTLLDNQADVVECPLENFTDAEQPAVPLKDISRVTVYEPQDALELLMQERIFHQFPVNKLFRRELVSKIKFIEGTICEDEYWTFQVIGEAKKIAYLDVVFYHYYQSANSVMRSAYSLKRLACIKAFQFRKEYMKKRFPELYPLAAAKFASACFFHYQTLCRHEDVDPEGIHRQELHSHFQGEDYEFLFKRARLKYKIWYWAFRHFPQCTCWLRNALRIGF